MIGPRGAGRGGRADEHCLNHAPTSCFFFSQEGQKLRPQQEKATSTGSFARVHIPCDSVC